MTPALVAHLREQFALDWGGVHGVTHWARVRVNGLWLAGREGANPRVVECFAFLHDARRENEHEDPDHGARGARLADELNEHFLGLDGDELRLLQRACEQHSEGRMEGPTTLRVCWDADRLDLLRVGIRPRPDRLCTESARDPAVIARAARRSLGRGGDDPPALS